MPKRLLRGVIDFGDGRLPPDSQRANWQRLSRAGFEWLNPDERKIADFVKEYTQENLEPPSSDIVHNFFERANELTVVDKLQDIKSVEVYGNRTHYASLLKGLIEDQNLTRFRRLIQDTEEIATKGRIVNKETLKGTKAALLYFNQNVYSAIPADTNARTEGEVLSDAGQAWEEYQYVKANRGKAYGRPTGLDHVDKVCHGCKKGEMWIHAAAPGELKTTMAMNWAYNLVTRYRANVLYISLEMKYEHLRRLACALHTSNGKYLEQGYKALDYRKIRDGELNSDEEVFYQEVLKDFETNPKHCRFKVWAPDHDVTIGDIRVYAELMHKSLEVGLIVIDHGGLVKAAKSHKDYTVELNSVLRDAKKLALHFNGGEGVPVLMLFQINRTGKETVDKKIGKEGEGLYNMSALAYSNEAEKSADYITTTYLHEDLRRQGATILANLKNRDNDLFSPTKIRVDFSCRRLFNWDLQDQSDIGCSVLSQEDVDAIGPLV
jgi:replicative DNA helicase